MTFNTSILLLTLVLFLSSCQNSNSDTKQIAQQTEEKKTKKTQIKIPENAYHFKSVAYDYYIQFEDNGKTAVITSGHINMKLPQRNTWAEGAEYGNDSITLFTGVKENVLINNGVKESLTLVNPQINAYTNDSLFAVVEFHKKELKNYALIRIEDGPYVELTQDAELTNDSVYINEEFSLQIESDTLYFTDKLNQEIELYKVQ